MKIGIVGLGKMGLSIGIRLMRSGHQVVGTDRRTAKLKNLEAAGGRAVKSPKELVAALESPRSLWLMVPPGPVVDQVIGQLEPHLTEGDLIIDGGDSHYKAGIRRGAELKSKGIAFVDVGTGGGIPGVEHGLSLTVGGDEADFRRIVPILEDLAAESGFLHTGPVGSGHFAKMVHNGIVSGLVQAYGEGLEILARSRFSYDLRALAHVWNRGGVVRSWLLELAERAFDKDPRLSGVRARVEDAGDGAWIAEEAMELDVPAPAITLSLIARSGTRQESSFSSKVVAALLSEFGGQRAKKAEA